MLTAARPPAPVARVLWGAAALALGLGAALLPLPLAAGAIGLAVLGVAALIEPALAVVLMLAIAPLKTLIETEAAVTLPIDVGQLAFGVTLGLWAAYASWPGVAARCPHAGPGDAGGDHARLRPLVVRRGVARRVLTEMLMGRDGAAGRGRVDLTPLGVRAG